MSGAAVAPASAIPTRDPEHRRVERLMGTVVSLFVPDGGATSGVADDAFAWLREAERRFSPFRPDSEVVRLMRGATPPDGVADDLAEVLEIADVVSVLSDGAFDIRAVHADRAPDPTGIVKGWSVERAAEILVAGGIERFSLGAGGDIIVRGGLWQGSPWRIGIANPLDAGGVAVVLVAHELAVATSGTAERGAHIVDGRTGTPASELLAVTVVGHSLARADGYATAAFAMGRAGLAWVDALPGYEAAGITHDGRLISTRGLDRLRA